MCETRSCSLFILLLCVIKVAEIRAQCGKHSVGENMNYNPAQMNEYPDGSTVTFSCLTGYVPVDSGASRSITCRGNQWTTLDLKCKKRSCGNPGEVTNGRYLTPDGIEFGAIITVECNEGHMSVGIKTRRCLVDGWDGRAAVCEQTKCLPPSKIENGAYDEEDKSYGYNEVVTYSCSEGYTLIGESSITCSSNGTFQPPPPQCLWITCEKPDVKNAIRVGGKGSSYGYKDFVEYKCIEGYDIKGDGYLVCDVNGWNPPPPQCRSPPPPNPPTKPPTKPSTPPPGPTPRPGPGPAPSPGPTSPPGPGPVIGIGIGIGVTAAILVLIGGIVYFMKRGT
ncbi:C4b-binding protein alpha chain-like isoform 2-T2 [Clarias gariepinus]|nr:membrane cofactor protein-like isoform X2 [Clarias gariepinus]